jgi:DNA replication protein DnaC
MLTNQTIDKLESLRLPTMADEYRRQLESPEMHALDFDARLGMLADAEWISRQNGKIRRLQKEACLRFPDACFAGISYSPARKLDRGHVARLSDFAWAREARNLIVTGCTGAGKTYLVSAFGAEACRRGMRVKYYRVSRLLREMAVAHGDGSYDGFLRKLGRTDLLILDDWGMAALGVAEGLHLLEAIEDRHGAKPTAIAAQLPVSKWHELFEDGAVADAVLDRVVSNAHRFELAGPSMRPSEDRRRPVGAEGGGGPDA